MPQTDPAIWSDHLRQTLPHYDESLLRQVAARLIKPRSHWPVDELIRRMVEATENAAVVDRRLREASPAGRQLLAAIELSRLHRWHVGSLIELLAALGHADPLAEVQALLECGLLFPDLTAGRPAPAHSNSRLRSFPDWLGHTSAPQLVLCAHPSVSRRALGEQLPLPDLSRAESAGTRSASPVREADGLEWPLRLGILWQQARAGPLRRTQQGDFFKRDLERLRSDPQLGIQPADALVEVPDLGPLTVTLARKEGVLADRDGQLVAGQLPATWDRHWPEVLAGMWQSFLQVDDWNAERGWTVGQAANPFPAAYLLCLLLLRQAPAEAWCAANQVVRWVLDQHPYWHWKNRPPAKKKDTAPAEGLSCFLLGVAHALRLVQARADGDDWHVRLSPTGRWLLGDGPAPAGHDFPQTLLVQPNLEIVAYRQGLTPALVARLTRFARWVSLGPACSLQLEPDTVYAALEAGESFETIVQTLQRHGIKPPPGPVLDSLRTWSQKRERITVYPAALILEFLAGEDLTDALGRGAAADRIADALAIVARESDIDYRHFRLISNRDYALLPEKCVRMDADGVTLRVDLSRSDLLLESELRRFADPVETAGSVRVFRLTPETLQRGAGQGLTADGLQAWFQGHCDQPLSAAARLLLSGPTLAAAETRRVTVVQVADADMADGLMQWPETRHLFEERLGPLTLVIREDNLQALREKMRELGLELRGP